MPLAADITAVREKLSAMSPKVDTLTRQSGADGMLYDGGRFSGLHFWFSDPPGISARSWSRVSQSVSLMGGRGELKQPNMGVDAWLRSERAPEPDEVGAVLVVKGNRAKNSNCWIKAMSDEAEYF